MANVLASVAGVYGFLEAMGRNQGVGTVAAEITSASAVGRAINYFEPFHSKASAPVTLTWAPRFNAFFNINIPLKALYSTSPGSSWGYGYPHKQLCFYNDANKLIFSIGLLPSDIPAGWSSGNAYPAGSSAMKTYIFFYGDASTTVPTSYEQLEGLPRIPGEVDGSASGAWFNSYGNLSFVYDWNTTTPSSSVLKIRWRGLDLSISSIDTKIQVTSKLIAKFTMGEAIVTAGNANNYYGGGLVRSVVVADDIDYSLTVGLLYPDAFGAVNQFTGAISSVNTTTQDLTYISSSAEVSSVCELSLADLVSYGNLDTIHKLDLFTFLRYVQAGGTSIAFTCSLVDPAGNVHASTVVNIAANEAETYCRTNKVLTSLMSSVTSDKYTLAQVQGLLVRISI